MDRWMLYCLRVALYCTLPQMCFCEVWWHLWIVLWLLLVKVLEEVLLEWWAAGSRITVSWKTDNLLTPCPLHVIPIFLRPLKGMGQNSFVSHSGGWHAAGTWNSPHSWHSLFKLKNGRDTVPFYRVGGRDKWSSVWRFRESPWYEEELHDNNISPKLPISLRDKCHIRRGHRHEADLGLNWIDASDMQSVS